MTNVFSIPQLIVYVIDLFWPSGSPQSPQPKAMKTQPLMKEDDNVEDDSYDSEKDSKKDSDSKAKSSPQNEVRKRRPRKD